MKSLDLNQLEVESFDIVSPEASLAAGSIYAPIVSTDQVPNCDGPTDRFC
jgi:hypothetical protein